MSESLQQPLTNSELHQHLDLESQRIQSYNPYLPDTTYVAPEDEALHVASHNWLKNRVDNIEAPLVSVNEQGQHILSTEVLHADTEELEMWIDASISDATRAIKQPDYARSTLVEAWKKSDPTITTEDLVDHVGTGDLTLSGLKDFLHLQTEIPHQDTRDKDLHTAGVDVTIALVDSWAKRQDENKVTSNLRKDDSEITLKLYEAPDGVQPLSGHFASEKDSFAKSFHELNRQKIVKLGQEALNAAGVRGRLYGNAEYTSQPLPPTGEDSTADETARMREMLAGLNNTSDKYQPPLPRAETILDQNDIDKNRRVALEEAVKNGTLHGVSPAENPRASLEEELSVPRDKSAEWVVRKAKDIEDYLLSPQAQKQLETEARSLLRPAGGYIDPINGDKRYREIQAMQSVGQVTLSNEQDVRSLFTQLSPLLSERMSDNVQKAIRMIQTKSGSSVITFGFNVDGYDPNGKPVFDFMTVG